MVREQGMVVERDGTGFGGGGVICIGERTGLGGLGGVRGGFRRVEKVQLEGGGGEGGGRQEKERKNELRPWACVKEGDGPQVRRERGRWVEGRDGGKRERHDEE